MKPNLISKPVGQDRMIYDPDQDALHILNPTAILVLELSQKGLDEAAIAAELVTRFQLAPGQDPRADVQACLKTLRAAGMVE